MIKIDGNEVLFQKNDLSIEDAIAERSTCSFGVYNNLGHYEKGQTIEIFDQDSDLIFSGVIDNSTERKITQNDVIHSIQCVDNHYYADKRIFAKSYQNVLAGDIVRDIITEVLSEEGITVGTIQDGGIVLEAVFNYAKVTDCLNSLAEKAGFWWKIDQFKKLHFVPRTAFNSPFILTSQDCIKNSISVKIGNPKYRNSQYIVGGTDETDPITESFVGDGERQTFSVGFPIARVPIITLNGNTQSVGIRGLETNKDWYWSKGDNTITQELQNTPLLNTDNLSINYRGQFPVVAIVINDGEVTNRQLIEGGTGLVEDVEDTAKTTTSEAAFEIAQAKLDKYGVIGRRLTFRTKRKGLDTGQLLTVNLPEHNLINAEMFIESISIIKLEDGFYYTVTAIEGPEMGSWTQIFYNLALKTKEFIIRENIREDQVLVILAQFQKTWLEVEHPNIFITSTLPFKLNTKLMFNRQDRVKYTSWYNGATELGRKRVTKQEGATGNKIRSTTFLGPKDANTEITHLGWWGGHKATEDIGTGIEVDKQPYEKTKTELEGIQVIKTDVKGW